MGLVFILKERKERKERERKRRRKEKGKEEKLGDLSWWFDSREQRDHVLGGFKLIEEGKNLRVSFYLLCFNFFNFGPCSIPKNMNF